MSNYLISDDDYYNLPEDPEDKFIAIEAICRNKMLSLTTQGKSSTYESMIKMDYMSTVSAASEELGLGPLHSYGNSTIPLSAFSDFVASANKLTTRLKIRRAERNNATSVQLTSRTRGLIEMQINKLREIISKSDLPDERKKVLLAKLDDLLSEVRNPRVSFGKVMVILAHIGMGVGLSTGFLADSPDAIATITKLIGIDKEVENQQSRRLGPPPKPPQLAPPKAEKSYDDESPF